jgi:hypothetical protein
VQRTGGGGRETAAVTRGHGRGKWINGEARPPG